MVKLDFSKINGDLLPAVAQDYKTGEVLMVAFMNEAAWNKTLETGMATYWSRSRNELWTKGLTSGNVQNVKEIFVDCDLDTVVLKVEQVGGGACHTGKRTCFYRKVENGNLTDIC
jgi:phosphoribosyl-AMP cyclohydrolase